MYILSLFLAITCIACRRGSMPMFSFATSWLLSLAPITLGLLDYGYFDANDSAFAIKLSLYLTAYFIGCMAWSFINPGRQALAAKYRPPILLFESQDRNVTKWIWFISIIAMIAQFVDYRILGAMADLNDLSALRDAFQRRASTPFTLVANVTSWACLFCFAYSQYYKSTLSTTEYLRFMLPTAGFFLIAVLSAGRQAAFQIILFILCLRHFLPDEITKSKSSRLEALAIVVGMIFYMGFVAVSRNDGAVSIDKTLVLSQLFDFQLGPTMHAIAIVTPPALVSATVEAMVYFSSAISLFSEFLRLEKVSNFGSYGAMTFPFFMRQLEPFTGISVLGMLQTKIALMYNLGSMGNGWTTGISSYILDFGYIGAFFFLLVQGYYTQHTYYRARKTKEFIDVLISVLMLVAAIYTPFLLASAETNLFLLWVACLALLTYRRMKRV